MFTRSGRWLRAEAPFVTVIALMIAASIYLLGFPGHWRRGTAVMAIALLGAAVMRAVLPGRHAGLLIVRGRWLDTLCYLALGGVILAVGIRVH